jgi:DMSO/TMAO reductase YedYZ molybdopterin-dependent catalytic subunit
MMVYIEQVLHRDQVHCRVEERGRMDRRQVFVGIAGVIGAGASASMARAAEFLSEGLPAGEYDTAVLAALPGKKPLIKLSYRPPNYETPLGYFRTTITPNDAFFVRYHLAAIPDIAVGDWRLKIGGEVEKPLTLTMAELRAFPPATVTAVCQCAGARRGWSEPHVAGVEWGRGAVGHAVLKGARLKDVLAKAGLRTEAIEIVLDGATSRCWTRPLIFARASRSGRRSKPTRCSPTR